MVDLKPSILIQSLHVDANLVAAVVMDRHAVPCCWLFASLVYLLSNKMKLGRARLVMGDRAFAEFARRGGIK
jgi:hypothetical protein